MPIMPPAYLEYLCCLFPDIKDLYINQKWPTNEIGKYLGLQATTIRRLLVRNGVKMRTRGDQRKRDVAGPKHSCWKGGRAHLKNGRIRIYCSPNDPRSSKNKKRNGELEHRLIAAEVLGRPLVKNEVVHHINGNGADNRKTNLLICTNSYHVRLHHKMADLYMKEHFGGLS